MGVPYGAIAVRLHMRVFGRTRKTSHSTKTYARLGFRKLEIEGPDTEGQYGCLIVQHWKFV